MLVYQRVTSDSHRPLGASLAFRWVLRRMTLHAFCWSTLSRGLVPMGSKWAWPNILYTWMYIHIYTYMLSLYMIIYRDKCNNDWHPNWMVSQCPMPEMICFHWVVARWPQNLCLLFFPTDHTVLLHTYAYTYIYTYLELQLSKLFCSTLVLYMYFFIRTFLAKRAVSWKRTFLWV